MEKNKETLNEEEKQLPTDDGQSENETTNEDKEESTEDEPEKGESKEEESEDELVTIPKTELEQLKSDNENYKRGIKQAKLKNAKLPSIEKLEKKQEDGWGDTDEFLTKKDYYKSIEREAIDKAKASDDMPQLGEHWDDVMLFYANRHGNTVPGYLRNIKDAYFLWEKDLNSPQNEEKVKTKEELAKLAQEEGSVKGKQKDTILQPKKSVLPKKESMGDWYK